MKLADHYDVICAGGGLSSFLCAALLSKSGKRVLVVDDEDQALPRVCESSAIFDPDFSIFSGLHESAALGRSLAELGLDLGVENFKPLDAITQVLSPEYRIIFWRDSAEACREVRRHLDTAGEAVCDFFSLLYRAGEEVPSFIDNAMTPAQGASRDTTSWKRFWGKKYYSAIARQKPLPLARALARNGGDVCANLGSAILGSVSYAAPSNLGCEQSLRGLALPLRGQYYHVGGLEALKNKLATIVAAGGGHVKRDTRVDSLISENRKITGVLLSSFEGVIRAETIVLASRLRRLYSTLSPELRDTTVMRGLRRIEPSHWRFTISVTVDRDVIPIGVTSNMASVGSFQHPLEEENYLRIRTLPAGLYPDVESGNTATLLVTALVPYRASCMDYTYLRRLGGKMLRALSEVMPFLGENIINLYPDFRRGEEELREYYPFDGPDWVPENLMQYYVRGHRAVQDFWGPSWTTPHQNLYFAGRSVWPSLGVYGEALTARKIFDDVMISRN